MTTATISPEFAQLSVLDAEGAKVPLASLWADRPVVLAFVRHFGWLLCREHVAQLREILPQIHDKGAELVVIGNGAPFLMRAFAEDTHLDTPLYTDPSLATYRSLGFKHGVLSTVGLKSARHAMRAFKAGFRQKGTQGEPYQQGGVLVAKKGGEIVWSFASNEAGDHPPSADVLAALSRVWGRPRDDVVN